MAVSKPTLVARFRQEAEDHLAVLGKTLLDLEKDPSSGDRIAEALRPLHTLKGAARMLRLDAIVASAHAIETVLVDARDELIRLDPAQIGTLLAATDGLQKLVVGLAVPAAPRPLAQPAPPAPDAVRVSIGKLDRTIKLVEELVAGRGADRENAKGMKWLRAALRGLAGRMGEESKASQLEVTAMLEVLEAEMRSERDRQAHRDLVWTELHQHALALRLTPIADLFGGLPRTVRDLALQLGKRVRLEISGGEVEIDRRIVEGLRDPLTHMVRNALDHGIEDPARRDAAGKPAEARLIIRAIQEGGKVEIEIEDDGRGIDLAEIRQVAAARGIDDPLGDEGVRDLLFLPGFSTAAAVTDVSGRGVGLDAVKRQVERLEGGVTVESTHGEGSVFRIVLPISLSLQTVVLTRIGNTRYALPHSFVVETRPFEAGGISLGELLGDSPAPPKVAVVCHRRGSPVAFGVDDVEDILEVAIKPMPAGLRAPLVAGFCTAGDRDLVAVLHVPNLVRLAEIRS